MATATQTHRVREREFCEDMLPKVSRTFTICIRLLPEDLRHAVLLAYLLCRVADTLEDTPSLEPRDRIRLLRAFARCLESDGCDADLLRHTFESFQSDEELLTREADTVLAEFRRLPVRQQDAVRPWISEMCAGMAEFAGRTRIKSEDTPLTTVDDLERYCYYVAGTVGHLLTELFRQHRPFPTAAQYQRMKSLATSFGLGLQLTNIIKDVADDRRRGQSFLPRQMCQDARIRPDEIQDKNHLAESRQVLQLLIRKAKGHLCDALHYSTALPRRHYGIRSFCLTSLYFAVATLRMADRDPRLLDPDQKVKIPRGQVYRTILITRLIAPVNWMVKLYFRILAGGSWWQRCRSMTPTSPATN
ncbi:MAG: phytoene/squalene synthase family protein [Gemmatimonadota bacterium]|nr:MAG: phytoene/squalene synthase family protein [Gemmatimonadota bacterium]